MNNPLISVIMPVYNGEKFLRETIDSVLSQTYQHFEFIIVNDGSRDATQHIVDSYDDKRIVRLNLTQNQGVCNARNQGIDLSKGDYIAFCDADDLYDATRLQIQLDFLRNNPAVDVCGSYFIVLENDQEVLVKHPVTDQKIKEQFFIGNCIGQPSVMGKSSVFRAYKYNLALEASEDYDLWARMATGGVVFANVPIPLVKYRLHPAQASKTKAKLLHFTSKNVCTDYTLAYLGNRIITEHSNATVTTLAEFKKFMAELSAACSLKSRDMNTFRPLIALQYKKLDRLGIRSFLMFRRILNKYRLVFPANYLLNIFLLSFICINKKSSMFDTLTKLKL